ncbi:vacuolar protein sorting-associated protein 51 related protein [Cyclospora cayetanensis]|uniref:Vacuolar protein sorting-associated protein 51 related protein n=1 Tax=Cyclospora cayetanensis TaxID=88456 RepID=A0A1D3D5G3_9EIME|nr:vacuolar protein sorting-associated protein 51 related protein [Cyclospora cayetanensis]
MAFPPASRGSPSHPPSTTASAVAARRSADGRPGRPLSRVEQMLHAYYDLEEAGDTDKAPEHPPAAVEAGGQKRPLAADQQPTASATAPDLCEASAVGGSSVDTAPAPVSAGATTARQPHGARGGVDAARQLLQEMPPLLHPSASSSPRPAGSRALGASTSPRVPPSLDLNSPAFDMQAYFTAAVRSCSLRELLRLTNELEAEVRILERDIRTLVYENYGKFLSATETVRRVRQAMGDIEQQLQHLSLSVSAIESSSGQLMKTVHERAAGIEDLVAFRQLIEQLQLLLTLPELLRQHLAAGSPLTALQVYDRAKLFLAKQNVTSPPLQRLLLLKRDAEAAAAYCVQLLKQQLDRGVGGEEEEKGQEEVAALSNRAAASSAAAASKAAGTEGVFTSLGGSSSSSSSTGRPAATPLGSEEASRIVRLLLRSGEDARELLRIYQRGRRHACLRVLERCCGREAVEGGGPSNAAVAEGVEGDQREVGVAGDASSAREGGVARTEIGLEGACSQIACRFVPQVAAALKDMLVLLRFIALQKKKKRFEEAGTTKRVVEAAAAAGRDREPQEAALVRRVREDAAAAEEGCGAIEPEGECLLLSFLTSLVDAAFSRLSATIASTVPAAASVLQGCRTVTSALEKSWEEVLLPAATLQQQALQTMRQAHRAVLLEATALTFKRAYAKVVQELHDTLAAATRLQLEQEQEEEAQAKPFSVLHTAKRAVAVTQQHAAAQCVIVEGCMALTDAQQLLQDAFPSPTPAEQESLLHAHITPWVAGLFELFLLFTLQLTRNVPAAFAGCPIVLETALAELQQPDARRHANGSVSHARRTYLTPQVEAALWVSVVNCPWRSPEARKAELPASERSLCPSFLSAQFEFLSSVLVCLRIGRHLQQVGLAKLEAVGVELHPIHSLVTAFVFYCGQRAAEDTIAVLAERYVLRLQPGRGSVQTCASPDRTGGGAFAPLVQALRECDDAFAAIAEDTARTPPFASAGKNAAVAATQGSSSVTEAMQQQLPPRRLARFLSRRRTAVEREMERLFARKQRVYGCVTFNRCRSVLSVFRIAARAVLEFVRGCSLPPAAVQQLQADCEEAADAVRQLLQPEDASLVDGVFDEIAAAGLSREEGIAKARRLFPHEEEGGAARRQKLRGVHTVDNTAHSAERFWGHNAAAGNQHLMTRDTW